MITTKDIAKRAGVSVATVSYVINNTRNVSRDRKERVLRAIEELNYVPNAAARGLRAKTSRTLGLIIADITNPFYPELAKACEDAAQAAGYSLIIMNTLEQEERFKSAVTQIREGKVDGLIVASAITRDKPVLEKLIKEGYPIVLAHRTLPGLKVDAVVADNTSGIASAVNYILALGHRKIAMMTASENSMVNVLRREGFIRTLKSNGIECKEDWIINAQGTYQISYNATEEKILRLPKEERPTAVIATNDMSALGVMDAVLDKGLNIPGDMTIIGFDDLFVAGIRNVQLTTVRTPRYDLGHQATRVLLDRLNRSEPNEPMEIVLPVQLVVRKTSGDIPVVGEF